MRCSVFLLEDFSASLPSYREIVGNGLIKIFEPPIGAFRTRWTDITNIIDVGLGGRSCHYRLCKVVLLRHDVALSLTFVWTHAVWWCIISELVNGKFLSTVLKRLRREVLDTGCVQISETKLDKDCVAVLWSFLWAWNTSCRTETVTSIDVSASIL